MAATDIFPRREHRWLLLTIVLLVVYPLVGALYCYYFWYPIRWIWEHNNNANFHIYYSTYKPHTYGLKLLWMQLLVYDLWSYLIFVHLPFVWLFDYCQLYPRKYKNSLIFIGLYLFDQMIPQTAIANVFPVTMPEEKLTFAVLVAITVYPFYHWILHPPGSESEAPYTDDDQVETRNSP